MKDLVFYLFASIGFVCLMSGLDLIPEIWSGRWWSMLVGFGLLANVFKPENGRDE